MDNKTVQSGMKEDNRRQDGNHQQTMDDDAAAREDSMKVAPSPIK